MAPEAQEELPPSDRAPFPTHLIILFFCQQVVERLIHTPVVVALD